MLSLSDNGPSGCCVRLASTPHMILDFVASISRCDRAKLLVAVDIVEGNTKIIFQGDMTLIALAKFNIHIRKGDLSSTIRVREGNNHWTKACFAGAAAESGKYACESNKGYYSHQKYYGGLSLPHFDVQMLYQSIRLITWQI